MAGLQKEEIKQIIQSHLHVMHSHDFVADSLVSWRDFDQAMDQLTEGIAAAIEKNNDLTEAIR
jgi:hypothetical protein